MHPNAAFRSDDRVLHDALIEQIGFGMVFAATPDGPRVAHVPLVIAGDDLVQFHLARGNALTRHLDGATALAVINGPDAYVSPRWYAEDGQVPTWNYVTLELEGVVHKLDEDGTAALLGAIGAQHESRIAEGTAWTPETVARDYWDKLMRGIVGFELRVQARRPTFKLSQNKSAEERDRIATGLEGEGSAATAQLMRNFAK